MANLNIKKRFLTSAEKAILSYENRTPFVYESDEMENMVKLSDFLTEHSAEVTENIYKFGAVLLRGFSVPEVQDFEHAITSMPEMEAMKDYFMSAPDRVPAEGSQYVYSENKKIHIDGMLRLGGFHTKNFHSADVPHFTSLWCSSPAKLGGETGLVNMAKVYDEFSFSLKSRLKARTFFTASHQIAEVAWRYALSEEQAKEYCKKFGLSFAEDENGLETVEIYKPSIVVHPQSGKPAFLVDASTEIDGLDQALLNEFRNSYLGMAWSYHRFIWRYTPLTILADRLRSATLSKVILKLFRAVMQGKNPETRSGFKAEEHRKRLGSAFEQTDINELSKSMRKHFASFRWQKGDVLIIDNLQMAHTIMPGSGTQTIWTILSTAVPLEYLPTSAGHQGLKKVKNHKSLASRMNKQKAKTISSPAIRGKQ
jgi:alpha-ketoglutarate-dependent taurine dioxygenase